MVGLVMLFFLSYVGVVVAIIGAILLIAVMFGLGRGARRAQPHQF